MLTWEDNERRNIRLARCHANYSRQRQQTLGGDHILVGGPANLNEEDIVHSNSTSTHPSPTHARAQRLFYFLGKGYLEHLL